MHIRHEALDAGDVDGRVRRCGGADCTPACAANQVCLASSRTQPTCVATCNSDADCTAPLRCALVVTDPEDVGMLPPTLSQAVCVSNKLLPSCGDPTATPCQLAAPM